MMKYRLISNSDYLAFCRAVNIELGQGFKFIGDLRVYAVKGKPLFVREMGRYDETIEEANS